MKKKLHLLFITVLILLISKVNAQFVVSPQIGILSQYNSLGPASGTSIYFGMNANVKKMVMDNMYAGLTIGCLFNTHSENEVKYVKNWWDNQILYSYSETTSETNVLIPFTGVFEYHYPLIDKLTLYGGADIGICFWRYKETFIQNEYTDNKGNTFPATIPKITLYDRFPFVFALQIGSTYKLNENLSIIGNIKHHIFFTKHQIFSPLNAQTMMLIINNLSFNVGITYKLNKKTQ